MTPAAPTGRPVSEPLPVGTPVRRHRAWRRRAASIGAVVAAVLIGTVLVVSDLEARAGTRTDDAAAAAAGQELAAVRPRLAAAEARLAKAGAAHAAAARSFAAAQSALTATQSALAVDEAGIEAQGVNMGLLDRCVSLVEQSLNQLAVGQTTGGLASLRASSSPCAALTAPAS
ncbi:MAG: hypothetical protein ACRDY1_15325 [Acidimicrobiales bacterium]